MCVCRKIEMSIPKDAEIHAPLFISHEIKKMLKPCMSSWHFHTGTPARWSWKCTSTVTCHISKTDYGMKDVRLQVWVTRHQMWQGAGPGELIRALRCWDSNSALEQEEQCQGLGDMSCWWPAVSWSAQWLQLPNKTFLGCTCFSLSHTTLPSNAHVTNSHETM